MRPTHSVLMYRVFSRVNQPTNRCGCWSEGSLRRSSARSWPGNALWKRELVPSSSCWIGPRILFGSQSCRDPLRPLPVVCSKSGEGPFTSGDHPTAHRRRRRSFFPALGGVAPVAGAGQLLGAGAWNAGWPTAPAPARVNRCYGFRL